MYHKELEKCNSESRTQTILMIELIEILESEKPSINHERLMYEINLYREKNNIVGKVPKEVMDEYKKIVLEMVEKQTNL